MKITKKSKISDIVEKQPKLAEILMTKYGLHCIGCFAAAFETLEQGAKAHGMDQKQIDKMIKDLNSQLSA
jgi:hybrid cluster-associated redox disulfide protein